MCQNGFMKIVVIGTGGVGAYFGAQLAKQAAEVHFLTTPRQVKAISVGGVTVTTDQDMTVQRPSSVTADASEIGPADLILLAVKLYQLETVLATMGPLVGPATIIVTLQNGVIAPRLLAKKFGNSQVAPGIASLISFLEGPGSIRQIGGPPALIVSDRTLAGDLCSACQVLVDVLKASGVNARTTPDIERDLWKKFALITTFGGVCALADAPIGPVRSFHPTRELLQRSLREAQTVAFAHDVNLTDADLNQIMVQLDASAWESTSSMQRDLRHGRRSELEYLNGELVRLADEKNIRLPLQEIIVAVLGLKEMMADEN